MAADRCCGADRGLDASRQLVTLAPGNPERILVDVPVNMEASMVDGERENEEQQDQAQEQENRLRQREERQQREHTDKDRDRESQERQRGRSGSRER
jgi:hypothetical protein